MQAVGGAGDIEAFEQIGKDKDDRVSFDSVGPSDAEAQNTENENGGA